jgi:YD repeat-containing protein
MLDDITRVAAEDGSEVYEFTASGRHTRTVDALTGSTRLEFSYDELGRLTAITDGDGLITQVQRDGSGAPTAIVAPFGQTTLLSVDAAGWLSRIVAPGNRTTNLSSTSSGLLTGLVDPNGNSSSFTYDLSGRLIHDAGPAGGSETLARTALPNGGWETTVTSAMGRARKYRTEILPATGAQKLTVTEADGTVSTRTVFADRSHEMVLADGDYTVAGWSPEHDLEEARSRTNESAGFLHPRSNRHQDRQWSRLALRLQRRDAHGPANLACRPRHHLDTRRYGSRHTHASGHSRADRLHLQPPGPSVRNDPRGAHIKCYLRRRRTSLGVDRRVDAYGFIGL